MCSKFTRAPRRSVVCAVSLCKGLLGYVCGFGFLETFFFFFLVRARFFNLIEICLEHFVITKSRLSLRICLCELLGYFLVMVICKDAWK
jgi:hypothetical protein